MELPQEYKTFFMMLNVNMENRVLEPFQGIYPNGRMIVDPLLLSRENCNLQERNQLYREKREKGLYSHDEKSQYYIYRITSSTHQALGLVGLIPHERFKTNFVVPHEQTQPDKELGYHQEFLQSRAQINPVSIFFRGNALLASQLETYAEKLQPITKTLYKSVQHEIIRVEDQNDIMKLSQALVNLKKLYIADGHHRVKASLLLSQQDESRPAYCLSMLIPDKSIRLTSIHRGIKYDIKIEHASLLTKIGQYFDICESSVDVSITKHEYQLYVGGAWYKLCLKRSLLKDLPDIKKLDSYILDDYLLKSIFKIEEQKPDKKLKFLFGSYSNAQLEEMVNVGDIDVVICAPSLSVEELYHIVDNGYMVPPHSTYIQPKTLDGMICWEY